jgi:hypothetical protein
LLLTFYTYVCCFNIGIYFIFQKSCWTAGVGPGTLDGCQVPDGQQTYAGYTRMDEGPLKKWFARQRQQLTGDHPIVR